MAVQIHQIDLNIKRRIDPQKCTLDDFRSSDPAMRRCLEMAWAAARTDLPVLILGETGTGKTLLGRAIHNSSPLAQGPFVSFNSAALSDTLLDSQLFGHEKGAFTGAERPVKGAFELADGGTLFIDEIADMSLPAQAKILRAVEYGEFVRLGSEKLQCADVRLITATHVPKSELLDEAKLVRKDLYYRLSGLTVHLPPLRSRPLDLPLLIAAEINLATMHQESQIEGLAPEALLKLMRHSWPGNLRELNRVLRAAVALCRGGLLKPDHLLIEDPAVENSRGPLDEAGGDEVDEAVEAGRDWSLKTAELRHVHRVLERMGGNKRQTARALGISRSTLDRKLAQG